MSHRRLFLASFGAHDAGEQLIRAALGTGVGPSQILYLCPSPRRLLLAQVELLRLSGRDALVPPRFATLPQLAREVHDRFGTARRLPRELKPLLVQRLLATGQRVQGFKGSGVLAGTPEPQPTRTPPLTPGPSSLAPRPVSIGYARAVADFITEVRCYVPKSGRTQLKARFEALLAGFDKPLARCLESLAALEQYEAELVRLNWSDDEGIMAEAVELAPRCEPPRVLVLDSFVSPDQLEADLLCALVQRADTTLALAYGSDPLDPDYVLANRFTSLAESWGGFELARLPAPPPVELSLFEYADAEEEFKAVCRDIVLRGTTDISDTFVAVPGLAEYAPLIKRVFEAYQVPVTVYPDAGLGTSPPIVAVLELLRCLDTGYERLATVAALSSPYLPGLLRLDPDEDNETRDRCATALNHYSRRAGIIKERRNWDKIHDRVLAAEDRELDEDEELFLRGLETRVRQATRMIDGELGSASTLGEYARGLKQLLGRAGFLSETDPNSEEDALLDDRKSLYDILDSLAAFEQEFGPERRSRSQFIKVLVYLVGLASRGSEPAPAGVMAVDMAETLGIHPRRLYFCGLTETSLPGVYHADPILPDRVRTALGMPDMNWHRDRMRFHFHRNLESSANPPFLSYHSSNQGQPVLPTPFLTLKPVKPAKPELIFSETERQLAQGQAQGVRFADTARVVNFVQDKDVLASLAERYGPAQPVSVTRLERYRRCPYLFYLEDALGIEALEEPRFDLDARQWGLVVHQVMDKLYARGPVPVERIREAALKALDATLREVELPVFWTEVSRRVFSDLLPDIVRVETELREGGFEPGRTELSLKAVLNQDILLRGRFDRVDLAGNRFRILDYKTGQPRNVGGKAVLEGTHLQLPLYAWLFCDKHPESRPDNLGIYTLREPDVLWFAGRKYTVEELIQAALQHAVAVVESIRTGRFPAEPGDDRACEYCGLGHTCGRRETSGER